MMNSMNLMDVIRQCSDQDLLGQFAETTLAKLMEFEVAERIGAGRHERCEDARRVTMAIEIGRWKRVWVSVRRQYGEP